MINEISKVQKEFKERFCDKLSTDGTIFNLGNVFSRNDCSTKSTSNVLEIIYNKKSISDQFFGKARKECIE